MSLPETDRAAASGDAVLRCPLISAASAALKRTALPSVTHATKREGVRLEWASGFAEGEKPVGQLACCCGVDSDRCQAMSRHPRTSAPSRSSLFETRRADRGALPGLQNDARYRAHALYVRF